MQRCEVEDKMFIQATYQSIWWA